MNILFNDRRNESVQSAWKHAGGHSRTEDKAWTYAKSSALYKTYAENECAYKKLGPAPCKISNVELVPYAMMNVAEYFASLFTSVYGLGHAGTGEVCKFDKTGC
jgi:hypothetical protein